MTALRGWGEQHLALDALVAFVDGELTPSAYDRAAAHLAGCPACAADAAAQRQARAAVRSAETPPISSNLLRALQSIPTETELPGQPDELALDEDGQLVTVARQNRKEGRAARKRERTTFGTGPVLGSSPSLGTTTTPLGGETSLGGEVSNHPRRPGGHGRRTKQGAGVVFSGLVLGALAFMNFPTDPVEPERGTTGWVPPPGGYDNAVTPVSGRGGATTPVESGSSAPPPHSGRIVHSPSLPSVTVPGSLASTPPRP